MALSASTEPLERPNTRIWISVSNEEGRDVVCVTGAGAWAICFAALQSTSKVALQNCRRKPLNAPLRCPEAVESFEKTADRFRSLPRGAEKALSLICGLSVF